MPLIKANEPLGRRSLVLTIQGDPGVGKSSLTNTAKTPLTIDGDIGISRSVFRKDAIVPVNWEEVLSYEKDGTFKKYSTIGIDTPKAVLDDLLMSYVVRQDPKLRNNKLWAYGAIGDEFKLFLNNRRQDQADLICICHSKKDEDTKRMVPDVTGQSMQLILRISDMIGYYTIHNGKRMIFFDPSETAIGKNVACLPPIEVPDKSDPAFRTFMADLIEKVRDAISAQSEEQLEALQKSELYQNELHASEDLGEIFSLVEEIGALPEYLKIPLMKVADDRRQKIYGGLIADCDSPEKLTTMLEEINGLSDHVKAHLRKIVNEKAKEKGWSANKDTKRFEAPDGAAAPPVKKEKPAEDSKGKEDTGAPAGLDTSFDERVRTLNELGMASQIDMLVGFGLQFTYHTIEGWTEDEYLNMIAEVNTAKKKPAKPTNRRQPAGAR